MHRATKIRPHRQKSWQEVESRIAVSANRVLILLKERVERCPLDRHDLKIKRIAGALV
jgi:hypothetical protein